MNCSDISTKKSSASQAEQTYTEILIQPLSSKKQRRVNRNAIPPSQTPSDSFSIKANFLSAPHLISLSTLNLSNESHLIFKNVAESLAFSSSFSLFDSLVHYCHLQFQMAKKKQNETFKMEGFNNVLDLFGNELYLACYYSLNKVMVEHLKKCNIDKHIENSTYFPSVKRFTHTMTLYIKGIADSIQSKDFKNTYLSRFQRLKGNYEHKYTEAVTGILTPLNEIIKVFDCIFDLLNLPHATLIQITEGEISNALEWPSSSQSCSSPVQEMKSYEECVLKMYQVCTKNAVGGVLVDEKHLIEFFSTLIKVIDVRSFDQKDLTQIILKVEELRHAFEVQQSFAGDLYRLASSGQLTYDQYIEQYHIKSKGPKTHDDFLSSLFQTATFCTTFKITLEGFRDLTEKTISKKTIHLSTDCLLKTQIISFKLNSLSEDALFWKEIVSCYENCEQALNSFADGQTVIKFRECHEKLMSLRTLLLNNEDDSLLSALNQMLAAPIPTYIDWHFLKESLNPLYSLSAECKKILEALNPILQKAVNESENFAVLSLFEKNLERFKTEISRFLSPVLDLPLFFNNLIIFNDKKLSAKILHVDIEDNNIPFLYNVAFNFVEQKTLQPVLKTLPPQQNNPKMQKATPPKKQVPLKTPKKIVSTQPLIIEEPQESAEDKLQSNKLGKLIQYLTDKGWTPRSIKGSHLKLEFNHQSLIVPINKPHLKEGTLNAILHQEKEKRTIEK